MRKIVLPWLSLMLFFFSSTAHAASGKAIVPHYIGNGLTSNFNIITRLFISNVTDSTATVLVRLYDKDGSTLDDDGSSSTGYITVSGTVANYDDSSVTGGTVTFDLAANSSVYLKFGEVNGSINNEWGYGVIEWSQSSDASVALLANVSQYYSYSSNIPSVSLAFINQGLPF